MPKAFWITFYRSISDDAALVRYASLATPAIEAAGGRILARGKPARAYEAGLEQRVVVVEFAGVAQAVAAYESPAYQAALAVLRDAAERDLRIVEAS